VVGDIDPLSPSEASISTRAGAASPTDPGVSEGPPGQHGGRQRPPASPGRLGAHTQGTGLHRKQYIIIGNGNIRRVFAAIGSRTWSRPIGVIRSADGSTRTETAAKTCLKSTRPFNVPRDDASGLPLPFDGQHTLKGAVSSQQERSECSNDEITVFAHALTRPFDKIYWRNPIRTGAKLLAPRATTKS
jgi:hypothetical protein